MSRITAFLFALLAAAATASADWPQWGGPNRNFTVSERGLAERWPEGGPLELWRRPMGDGYAGIVQDRELLFTMFRDGERDAVVALNANTGETSWTRSWEAKARDFMDLEFGPGPHSTPLVAGEKVFAVGATGRLVAIDRSTGREVWARELWQDLDGTRLERGYAASPIAFGDLVILPVGGPGRSLVAFRQSNGNIAWSSLDHGAAYSSPILADVEGDTQLVALLDSALVSLEPRTGTSNWSLPVSDYRYVNVASPIYTDGGLLFLSSSEGGWVLELGREGVTGAPKELWVGRSLGSQVGNVVRVGDHLYGTRGYSAASYMTAVDVHTGEMAWRDRAVGDCTLIRVGDRALVLESDGRLHLARLSPSGLDSVASAQVLQGRSWTAPTLVGTRLYLRNRSEIIALDLGDPENRNRSTEPSR